MKIWNLFRFLKKRNSLVGRPIISNPITISQNLKKDCCELDTKKKIIDAKSEKNMAGLEEIKATLLQWKEEDNKIFTNYKTEKLLLSRRHSNNKFSQSLIPELGSELNFWRSQHEYSSKKYELYSDAGRDNMENLIRLSDIQRNRQVSVRRLERSNSFRDLGKVLIRRDVNEEQTDFF